MAENEHYGFLPPQGVTDYERSINGITKEMEKLEKMTKQSRGFFNAKDLKSYERGMLTLDRRLGTMRRGYQQAAREAAAYRRELEAIQKAGGSITGAQRIKMNIMDNSTKQWDEAHRNAALQRSSVQRRWQRDQERRSKRRQVGSALAGGGVAVAGWIVNSVNRGLSTLNQNQLARGGTYALDPNSRGSFGSTERGGMRLGYTPVELHQRYQRALRVSGIARSQDVMSNLAIERGYGVDSGSLGGLQSSSRQAGGAVFAKDLNTAMLQGFKKGGYARPLMDEFVKSAADYVDSITSSREKVDTKQTMGLIGLLSDRLGGVYKDSPRRTTQVLQGLHGTISQPGGGEAGNAFMLRAMGMGQGNSYVKSLEMMERGATPGNIKRMMGQIQTEYGGESLETRMLLLNRLSGGRVKLHQARRLFGINTDDLNTQTVTNAMSQQTVTPGKDARGAARYTGIKQMMTGMEQQLAGLAGAALPEVQAAFQIQAAAIKASASGFRKVNKSVENLGIAADKTAGALIRVVTGLQLFGPKKLEELVKKGKAKPVMDMGTGMKSYETQTGTYHQDPRTGRYTFEPNPPKPRWGRSR